MFKNKKHLSLVGFLVVGTTFAIVIFWRFGGHWSQRDHSTLDYFYQRWINSEKGPPTSDLPLYLVITDETYQYFESSTLRRQDLARVNQVLEELEPEQVAYDIIFSHPSHKDADEVFARSIKSLSKAYLPVAFDQNQNSTAFHWGEGAAYAELRQALQAKVKETGKSLARPAHKALLQADSFANTGGHTGHINVEGDEDGIFRHVPLLIKVDSGVVPSLPLIMFLDYMGVPLNQMQVEWGTALTIPSVKGSFLEKDVVVPIDKQGRTTIPFVKPWREDFDLMTVHTLLKKFENPVLQGNLAEFFQGRLVFVADISQGISDIGRTPLEGNVPLVSIHTAMLNGFLTQTFFRKWTLSESSFTLIAGTLLLGIAAAFRASWPLYLVGVLVYLGTVYLTWYELNQLVLVPVFSLMLGLTIVLVTLVVGLQVATTRDQAFIRGAFARYLPETVVNELLAQPDRLQLGGEERVLTVLFSDMTNFTNLSEKLSPTQLVQLLNEYLSEMTEEVFSQNGIIDKYEGDAIMAEFGAPIPSLDHADRAVNSALAMQKRLSELRPEWLERGFPEIHCRIGINTGPMVLGNMGSDQVMDYTVMGDAVNLGSRLEGANKLYGTAIMISQFTLDHLTPGLFHTRLLDLIKVKGKDEAVRVFEVVRESDETISQSDATYFAEYQSGYDAYLNKDFSQARTAFEKALSFRPGNPAALLMIKRVSGLENETLPSNWDGAIRLTEK